ncbi:transposase [Streptomyces sp. NPDC055722]
MKVYSPEVKADAAALCSSDPDLTIAQTARDLGINAETLRNWIRADRARGGISTTRKNVTSTTRADPGKGRPGECPADRPDRKSSRPSSSAHCVNAVAEADSHLDPSNLERHRCTPEMEEVG